MMTQHLFAGEGAEHGVWVPTQCCQGGQHRQLPTHGVGCLIHQYPPGHVDINLFPNCRPLFEWISENLTDGEHNPTAVGWTLMIAGTSCLMSFLCRFSNTTSQTTNSPSRIPNTASKLKFPIHLPKHEINHLKSPSKFHLPHELSPQHPPCLDGQEEVVSFGNC